jgi:diguanylate cyclase (GGDEF)-like protein/PAS domain S-box-containing protein
MTDIPEVSRTVLKVAIVGNGGAARLIELIASAGGAEVVGVACGESVVTGLPPAGVQGAPTMEAIRGLKALGPDVVINADGDPAIDSVIRGVFPEPAWVIGGAAAALMARLIERQRGENDDLCALFRNSIAFAEAGDLNDMLGLLVGSAVELTGAEAGSIALVDAGEIRIAASAGAGAQALDNIRLSRDKDPLAAFILGLKEPAVFNDMDGAPLTKGSVFDAAGFKSLLVAVLAMDGSPAGAIFLYDRRPARFAARQKDLMGLFSPQAACAIGRFKLLGELEESLASLEGILEGSQDMIIAADNEGRIVRFSKGLERILGYAEDEVLGRNVLDFYRDREDRAEVINILNDRGAVYNYETVLIRKDGSPVDISLTMSRLRDRAGSVVGTVGVSKDITVEKRLRSDLEELNRNLEEKVLERTRDLERANRELRNANELKGRFIANASHELRTPLHSIIGFSEVLLQGSFGELNEKQRKFLATVHNSGKHLLHLVNNILDLAKIEAGKSQVSYSMFQVAATVEEILAVVRPLAEKKLIRVDLNASRDADDFTADKVKFKQILYNLLSNAIKFTPNGGRVEVRSASVVNGGAIPWAPAAQRFLRVTVTDTGPGIRPDDREKVFDEFEQLDPSRSTEGTGLGLSLTKRLVEIHGGHIEVGGVYGSGAVVDVYLPHFSSAEAYKVAPLGPEAPHTEPPDKAVEGALVLVVNDDANAVGMIASRLSGAGYRVERASDGAEALAKALALKPFLITLDMMLPGNGGWEALKRLKGDPVARGIPVLIHSTADDAGPAFALGATDYIIKPVDEASLLERLKGVLKEAKRNHPAGVLLITRDPRTLDSLHRSLRDEGLVLHYAVDEDEGIDLAIAARPNAMIVDVDDPESGFATIERLKQNPSLDDTPLFVLASGDVSEGEGEAFMGQAVRMLRKGVLDSGEFVSHIENIEALYPEKAGLVDGVTGLFNRKYLKIRLGREMARARRYNLPLVFLAIEVDGFDHYVREKGVYYGNIVLRKVAELLKGSARGTDVLLRCGGSEYGMLLTDTLLSAGTALARRFISIIHDYPFLHEEIQPGGRVTISIGAAELDGQGVEDIIGSAEAALSEAGKKGGGKLEVYGKARPDGIDQAEPASQE